MTVPLPETSSSALLGNIIRNLHVDHGLLPINLGESLIDI